jgi:hypothetical protein
MVSDDGDVLGIVPFFVTSAPPIGLFYAQIRPVFKGAKIT